jgi:hypothetical protein
MIGLVGWELPNTDDIEEFQVYVYDRNGELDLSKPPQAVLPPTATTYSFATLIDADFLIAIVPVNTGGPNIYEAVVVDLTKPDDGTDPGAAGTPHEDKFPWGIVGAVVGILLFLLLCCRRRVRRAADDINAAKEEYVHPADRSRPKPVKDVMYRHNAPGFPTNKARVASAYIAGGGEHSVFADMFDANQTGFDGLVPLDDTVVPPLIQVSDGSRLASRRKGHTAFEDRPSMDWSVASAPDVEGELYHDEFAYGDRDPRKDSSSSLKEAMAAVEEGAETMLYPTRSWRVFQKFSEHPVPVHKKLQVIRKRPKPASDSSDDKHDKRRDSLI